MGGTGTVPHCAVLSSFVATIGKISLAAAGGPPFNNREDFPCCGWRDSCRAVPQPFKK